MVIFINNLLVGELLYRFKNCNSSKKMLAITTQALQTPLWQKLS